MIRSDHRRPIRSLGLASLAILTLAGPATAQTSDFLFEPPSATLGLRLGYAVPRAGSEIFDLTREQLTVDKSDFNAFSLGGALAVRLSDRFDVALDVAVARSETRSEFRDFIGTDDLPIEQETRFTRVPATVGVKAYLWERGRRISRFAWIPERLAPYVGAGGGVIWHRFQQVGEFVDFETLEVFPADFESSGTAPLAYVAAGADVSIGKKWFATGEGRYSWASAGMDRGFVGFDDIDLAGFTFAVGLSVRL